jgi:glutamate N-acetyltransferase/amino-acid N-acetyltransferase
VFPTLNDDEQAGKNACLGIMTTDTIEKYAYEEITLSGKTVKLAGICKGSGMIHPNMATMLSFVTTDVNISSELLRKALSESVSDTYNMVSVDRDTSTNDSAVVLASGLAENKLIDSENEEYFAFLAALNKVNKKLAMYIARDGEGATKLIEVTVSGADTDYNARKIAKAVVSSNLFKAAMFGADANWGRALCAMGYSGASFDPSKVRLEFSSKRGHITVYDTQPIVFDENEASEIISERKICVTISLDSSMSAGKDSGGFSAVAWGCDLTYDYVRINGDYRS